MDSELKDRHRRVEVGIKVNLKYPDTETFEERFSVNVSRSGIFIRAKDPAPLGSRIHFEYRLADDSRVMRGVGIVRWVRGQSDATADSPPGMGLEFVDLDQDTEALIDRIVARFGEGKRAPQRQRSTGAQAATKAKPAERKTEPTVLAAADESALDALLDTLAEDAPVDSHETPQELADDGGAFDVPVDLEDEANDDQAHPADFDIPVEVDGEEQEPEFDVPLLQPELEAPEPEPEAEAEAEAEPEPEAKAEDVEAPAPEPEILEATEPLAHATLELDFSRADVMSRVGTAEHPATLRLGDAEAAVTVPDLASWILAPFPSARAKAIAQELGLSVSDDGQGAVALAANDGPARAGRDILTEVIRTALDRPDVGEGAPKLIVPATLSATARGCLIDAIRDLGLQTPELVSSAQVLVQTHLPNLQSFERVLILEIAAVETRINLVEGGGHVVAARSVVSAGTLAAERRMAEFAALSLLREHGIDTADDPSFGPMLMQQVQTLRQSGADTWHLSLAGADVELASAALHKYLQNLSEQVALAADAALAEAETDLADLADVFVSGDPARWPGLLEVLTDLLGRTPRQL